ncbi:peptidase [Polaribacter pectinis]|uniref:Peptidase n=1 Tax=Polaribacter pectinis TaxID=2738844 RepID=A0A7G9L7F7_9FLAO|nr:peptidase [Polaribacter pectinis]QNM84556.1 peptidase [Polaribacter pectinis]
MKFKQKNIIKIVHFLFLFPLTLLGQANIDYKVFYSDNLEKDGLKVQISFTSKKVSDSTYFRYSNQFWGETNLLNCLKIIQKENPSYTFKVIADENRIVVYHPESKNISFTYHIIQDIKSIGSKAKNRPLVQDNYFHVLGESLFIVPEELYEEDVNDPEIIVNIKWLNFPKDFVIHNTFGSQQLHQTLKIKLWSEFYYSLFVGGDYRIKSFKYLEKPIHFAIRGKWLGTYTDDSIFKALEKAIKTQRAFWNDNNFDYYTFIMTPTKTHTDSLYKKRNTTGTALNNGFFIQASNSIYNDLHTIKYMFNHEMNHEWIGVKIKNKHKELNYWFSEGFTEYYTFKNALRSGDLTLNEWVKEFNLFIIKKHWKNPEKNKPNYIIKDNFWKSKNFEKIPYRRGAIFAFWVDNQIIKKSNYTKSLDDVMRDVLNICTTQNRKFTDELFLEIVEKYLDKDISYFFQKYIINGEDILFKNKELIDGFKIEYVDKIPQIIINNKTYNNYIF